MLIGNYSGTPLKFVTLLQGIKNKASDQGSIRVEYSKGCKLQSELIKKIKFSSSLDRMFDIRNAVAKNRTLRAEFFNNKCQYMDI